LWPFHEVHHSAEVLSPLSYFRAHPLYFFVQTALISTCTGILQGAVAVALFGWVDFWVLYAATLPILAYQLGGVHLRHSHVPLRFGVLEHVVISPYLHQLHHSTDPRHRDKNFGEVLSIWDRMFGTLIVPDHVEPLSFGLVDGNDGGRVQPYPTLEAALFLPFARASAALPRPWRRAKIAANR
jgi:sterol desaturase/sphingolipid hydroxylase (fatty acid hydroxylase superfamily)